MSGPDQPFDPKRTMQVDAAEVTQDDAPVSAPGPTTRRGPPPLPPSASVLPSPPRTTKRTLAYAALFVVMIAVAAVGGLMFAGAISGPAPTVNVVMPSPSPGAPAASPASSGAPSASATTVDLPPVEIH